MARILVSNSRHMPVPKKTQKSKAKVKGKKKKVSIVDCYCRIARSCLQLSVLSVQKILTCRLAAIVVVFAA